MNAQTVRVTKKFTFDMAHALYGYDGPCKNIHGHTYHLHVTILGKIISDANNPKQGMVLDFKDLKNIVKEKIIHTFDHALVLNEHSPHKSLMKNLEEQFEKIIFLPTQPSCENLLLHFQYLIAPYFSAAEKLVYMKLEETPSS